MIDLVFFGIFGMLIELCFTAVKDLIRNRDYSLVGHTSLWMFPVYALGLTYGFDFVKFLIADDLIRYLSYPLWIWAVELLIGIPAVKRDVRIWDYNYLPDWLHYRGIISFAHYPLWVGFGVLVELVK